MDAMKRSVIRRLPEYLLVLSFLAALILTALWPWPRHFRTGFPDHFDPPFHAWKLQVGADKILRQHRLVPDTQTNVYYPYANEFYFDALLWPQAMLAALLAGAGCGPILTYNLVFLFFWALSGFCMYLLLRELSLRRLPSLFGAAAMCLIPYRVSYYVEFNMQMCFGLPLFLYFWVRYARRPGVVNVIGLGLAFWLQAISELYQAVILALSFPLLILPYAGDIVRRHATTRRFWISVAVGLAIVVPLCLLYLGPYCTLFHGGYGRSLREMERHSLAPLAYLGRDLLSLLLPPGFLGRVKFDEMRVFPSLTLLLLVAGHAIAAQRVFWRRQEGEPGHVVALRWLRLTGLAGFAGLILFLARTPDVATGPLLSWLGNGTLVLALAAGLLLALFAVPGHPAPRLCQGLAVAALLCFALSLGPSLRVFSGHDKAGNLVFSLVSTFFPLNGFRVMSRFSIIVMLFLIVAGTCFLDTLAGRRPVLRWLALPMLLTLFMEAQAIPHHYRRFSLPISRSLLDTIRSGTTSVTVIPLGERYHDARYMLAIGGTRTLLVNGFGGFSPMLQQKIGHSLRQRPGWALSMIGSIWPPSLLLVDRQALAPLNREGYATTEAMIRAHGRLVQEDRNFALYAMAEPQGTVREYRRFVRGDLLEANPVFRFEARSEAPGGQDLFVLFNGTVVGALHAGDEWQAHQVLLPRAGITGIDYEMVFVRGLDGQGAWMARNGTFGPVPEGQSLELPDYAALAARVWHQGAPAWMRYVTDLPPTARAMDLEFDNGVRLVGLELPARPVARGGSVTFRTFWTIPPSVGRVAFVTEAGFIGPNGNGFFSRCGLASRMPVTFVISQPGVKIFVVRHRLAAPATLPMGTYRFQVRLMDALSGRKIGVHTASSLAPGREPVLRIGRDTSRHAPPPVPGPATSARYRPR